tara:strand:- start:323 stop:1132 length:810 start_codon:yes stop_codon:yes gene_type:complete
MADRFPLIANTSANQIQELSVSDNLDLTGNSIVGLSTITVGSAVTMSESGVDVTGIVTSTSFSGSAANLTSIPAANIVGVATAGFERSGGFGGGGALEFISKTTVSSSTYTVDFTGLDYGYVYKLYSKKVLLSGQIQANNQVFFIRFFINGGSSVITNQYGYQYRNNALSYDNAHYDGSQTSQIPMFAPTNAFTRCALDIEFSTDYYGWVDAKLFATSDERPYNLLAGALNNSQYPHSSNRISGIRIYFQYTYDIEPGSEFLLYRYKES